MKPKSENQTEPNPTAGASALRPISWNKQRSNVPTQIQVALRQAMQLVSRYEDKKLMTLATYREGRLFLDWNYEWESESGLLLPVAWFHDGCKRTYALEPYGVTAGEFFEHDEDICYARSSDALCEHAEKRGFHVISTE